MASFVGKGATFYPPTSSLLATTEQHAIRPARPAGTSHTPWLVWIHRPLQRHGLRFAGGVDEVKVLVLLSSGNAGPHALCQSHSPTYHRLVRLAEGDRRVRRVQHVAVDHPTACRGHLRFLNTFPISSHRTSRVGTILTLTRTRSTCALTSSHPRLAIRPAPTMSRPRTTRWSHPGKASDFQSHVLPDGQYLANCPAAVRLHTTALLVRLHTTALLVPPSASQSRRLRSRL